MAVYDLTSFKTWLVNKKYSTSTVRNYLSDVHKYISSIPTTSSSDVFSESSFSAYASSLSDKSYAPRALASLNKFCQFAIDQRIISTNPINNTFSAILLEFKNYLANHHKSDSTITNYLNDIKQFINYSQKLET